MLEGPLLELSRSSTSTRPSLGSSPGSRGRRRVDCTLQLVGSESLRSFVAVVSSRTSRTSRTSRSSVRALWVVDSLILEPGKGSKWTENVLGGETRTCNVGNNEGELEEMARESKMGVNGYAM